MNLLESCIHRPVVIIMCLIFVSYQKNPDYPLIIAANRDEYYARPTACAGFWQRYPDVLAGMDLQHQGTWLGITRTGRLSFITNYRNPALNNESARSRGELTRDYLTGEEPAALYMQKVLDMRRQYNGFNLVAGDLANLYYCASELDEVRHIAPGNYGLSNGLLDSPWPKVVIGKQQFIECIKNKPDSQCLMAILADQTKAGLDQLPETGVGLELEHTLSSRFISTPLYGTRSSTLITVDSNYNVHFIEKNHAVAGQQEITREYHFKLEKTP